MELGEKDLENILGGANPKAVDAKLEGGYNKTFRDKVLEAKFGEVKQNEEAINLENVLGGANPKVVDNQLKEGYNKTFRDKVLEARLAEMGESEEKGRSR